MQWPVGDHFLSSLFLVPALIISSLSQSLPFSMLYSIKHSGAVSSVLIGAVARLLKSCNNLAKFPSAGLGSLPGCQKGKANYSASHGEQAGLKEMLLRFSSDPRSAHVKSHLHQPLHFFLLQLNYHQVITCKCNHLFISRD